MTEDQLRALGPALDSFLHPYLFCCDYTQTFEHLRTYFYCNRFSMYGILLA